MIKKQTRLQDRWSTFKDSCRISKSRYPHGTKAALGLSGTALALLSLLLWNKFYVALPDFRVTADHPDTWYRIIIVAGPLIMLSGALYYITRLIHLLPWRTALLIVVTAFLLFTAVAITTPPTASQDVYWGLLLSKGFSQQGLNPYMTTPADLSGDAWSQPVLAWRSVSMIYGPLWVLFLSGLTYYTTSLSIALLLIKLTMAVCVAATGLVLWKILRRDRSPEQSTAALTLFLWNPFIIQVALIDAHNDVPMMLSFCLSYYLLIRRYETLSFAALFFGGLIKYVSWLMLPIPLIMLIGRIGLRRSIAPLLWMGSAAAVVTFLCYLPFGNPLHLTSGLAKIWDLGDLPGMELTGSFFLNSVLGMNSGSIRFTGFAIALLLELILVMRNRIGAAYIWPIATLLFLGTPWFAPWYVLWIFPLVLLAYPSWIFVILGISLLMMNEIVTPMFFSTLASTMVLMGAAFWIMARYPIRLMNKLQDIDISQHPIK